MTVGEFIDGFVLVGGDSTRGYLAQHNLLDQVRNTLGGAESAGWRRIVEVYSNFYHR